MAHISSHNLLAVLSCVIVGFLLVEAKYVNFNKCYNSTRNFYPYLTSKTADQLVYSDIERPAGCTPLQIWTTEKHGMRYLDTITKERMIDLETFRDRIIENHENGRGQMCSKDLNSLSTWQKDANFDESKTSSVGNEGKQEVRLVAKPLKNVSPEVSQSKEPKSYNFVISKPEPPTSSLISFANSLFNTNGTLNYEEDGSKESKKCEKQIKEEEQTEFKKFKEGPYVRQTLLEISQRLGFTETVEFDTIFITYEMCRYETALHPKNISVWCTVFSKEDLMIFEYLNDLDYYYCCGPGNKQSQKLSCGVLKNLFKTFSQLENANVNNQPNGIFNFGHSPNVESVMTLLKVFHPDEPLLASNYESLKNHLFNGSFINKFSSNVVAVFYRCDNSTTLEQIQSNTSENPVNVSGCGGHFCDWEYLKREFKPVLDSCDTNVCDLPPKNNEITNASSSCGDSYMHFLASIMLIIFTYLYV